MLPVENEKFFYPESPSQMKWHVRFSVLKITSEISAESIHTAAMRKNSLLPTTNWELPPIWNIPQTHGSNYSLITQRKVLSMR